MIAIAVVSHPATSWRAARDSVGSARAFMARHVSVAITGAAGIPDVVADLIDERLPIVAAVSQPKLPLNTEPGWAAAVHVRDPVQLAIRLTGQHQWTKSKTLEMVKLSPPKGAGSVSLATIGNYLIAASSDDALREIGPYLATNLARRAPVKFDLHVELRDGALGQWLALAMPKLADAFEGADLPWQAQAVLSKRDLLRFGTEVLPQLGVATIDLLLQEDSLLIDGEFSPHTREHGQAWSKVPAVDASRIGVLPSDVMGAMTMRRESMSPPSFPPDVPAGAKAALEKTAAKLDAAAQGEFLLGVRCTGVGVTGFLRAVPPKDDAIADAVVALEEAASDKRLIEPLKKKKWRVSAQKTRIERVNSDVLRVRFAPLEVSAPSGHQAELLARQNAVDVLLAPVRPILYAAAGRETVKTIQQLVNPPESDRLADLTGNAAILQGFDDRVWAAAYVDPQAVNACAQGTPGGATTAPVTIAISPSGSGDATVATLRVRLARSLLRLFGR